MIKLYNSLTKKKEEFEPITKGIVKMYSCGPTVYNFAHIGNFRSYHLSDILSRTLKYFGFKILNVINLTDVDDKTIRDSKKEFSHIKDPNQRLKEFTEKYTKYFLEDCEHMNLEKPWSIIKATNSVKEMEILIQSLFDNGYAYTTDDGIYFNVAKNKGYGQLVEIDINEQQYNKENRVVADEYEKDNAQDFALWKFKKDEDEPSWEITVNKETYEGRPGWHLECSAMNLQAHGPSLDIHTGGVDLKFPHHENEIAQSECAHNEKYVNYWVHNEFLLVDGKKMSKSLGNFYTLRDLEEKGFSALALREVYLRSHYSSPLNFTLESLKAGEINVKTFNDFYTSLKEKIPHDTPTELSKVYDVHLDAFETAIKDDLNTPEALSSVYDFMNKVNKLQSLSEKDIEIAKEFMKRTDKVLGLLKKEEKIPQEIKELAEKRKEAREEKNYSLSDTLRDKLQEKGWEIKDSKEAKEGYILSKI